MVNSLKRGQASGPDNTLAELYERLGDEPMEVLWD